MLDRESIIIVDRATKVYKLYARPSDRVKEALDVISNKSYHTEHYALRNVSLDVKKGETVGIIGKNGSGKSTLLKMVAGVLTPTYGHIQVKGRITSLLELGAGFNPEYTGVENVYLNGSLLGYTREEMTSKLDSILQFADIGDYVYQAVKTYSSGMFARLAFAVMIHMDPDVLIVDEALSVGDIFFQQKCNLYMKEKMKNTTKILVTHDMNSIANMADRVVVLSKGEIVYEGEPLRAIEYYVKSMHTEGFASHGSLDSRQQETTLDKTSNWSIDLSEWDILSDEQLGGAQDVMISHYRLQVNGEDYKGYIISGDRVKIQFLIATQRPIPQVIFGYIVSDKFGNKLFGENTVTSQISNLSLPIKDRYLVDLEFNWPEIKDGSYFITLGVGEGDHALQHVIQCWAHNIIEFKAISPNRIIHCLFNNPIKALSITSLTSLDKG